MELVNPRMSIVNRDSSKTILAADAITIGGCRRQTISGQSAGEGSTEMSLNSTRRDERRLTFESRAENPLKRIAIILAVAAMAFIVVLRVRFKSRA